jgi:hypothetical protein
MSGPSHIDSLRRISFASDAEAAEVFGIAGREALLETVTQLPFGGRRQPQHAARRRRPLVLALALVVAAGTAAAAWAILGSSARETTSVECVIRGADTIIPAVSGDPAYDCAVAWKNDLGTEPPALVAYDNADGGVTVIPRSEKPEAGWKPLPAGQDVALIQLQDSLDDYVSGLNSSCLDATAATSLARSKLAQFGFTGWTVTVRSGPGTCVATDVVDPARQTVTLIPSGPLGPASARTLADRLRPLTQKCESLPAAESSVRAAAAGMTYRLNAVRDSSLRCASVYETVGGTIFLTVRGPSR